ncbi:MAG TPA: HigA family addiction module antitoxin [Candidatus Hydrogenedentes bacterium]|nr:HigA family addiction module antitoxin [Candidatus Hydrogenedentota bacterium]HPG67389.1 HigA family addiction module antitoxin [Candidatus Hydrogenedentota bacterium]
MATNETIHADLAIPPGEYLEEVLGELGMSKDDLARRMGRPAAKLSPIFKGDKAITPETALQLEKVVGVPAHIWAGLESEYRLALARQAEAECDTLLHAEAKLAARFCYSALVKAGEVERRTKPVEKAQALRDYFGVMSLNSVPELQRYRAAFRCGRSGERSREAVAAWLRLGERRAQGAYCAPFDETRLREALDFLRALTLEASDHFQASLRTRLAACGVALVICPHFPKTRAHGATFWLGRDKAVLMLTIRGKWADIFWFSLFHEIGHILLHGRQAVILEGGTEDRRETEADRFAADTLIPEDAYRSFLEHGRFYSQDVVAFANSVGVHPGVVVGRLQHEKRLKPEWGNDLRVRYRWAETED